MGGILADVMGLGKTLSMISAVVSSLPQAAESARAGYQKCTLPVSRYRTRATLVIVTSMRKSSLVPLFLSLSIVLIVAFCVLRGPGRLEKGDVHVRISRTSDHDMLTI